MPFEKVTALGRWLGPTREVVEPNRGLGRSFSPAFRTRMGFSACWMSQDLVAAADLTPFVRAVARTFTRAVRALCRGPPRPPFRILRP